MSDLMKRLRDGGQVGFYNPDPEPDPLRVEAADRIASLEAALEQIAEYLPRFDYVGSDEFGIRMDRPGSPYDRGREQEAKHLSGIARAALKGDDQ